MQVAKETLRIADMGMTLALDYTGALTAHRGESWFGVAVAFRMLQFVGRTLSHQRLWDRQNLTVVSTHSGSGVRDAVEYVTRCVSRGRYYLIDESDGDNSGSQFSWQVCDGHFTGAISLRRGFATEELFRMTRRVEMASGEHGDAGRLAAINWELSEKIWRESLENLFCMDLVPAKSLRHA
jgi:hypothetical protein